MLQSKENYNAEGTWKYYEKSQKLPTKYLKKAKPSYRVEYEMQKVQESATLTLGLHPIWYDEWRR